MRVLITVVCLLLVALQSQAAVLPNLQVQTDTGREFGVFDVIQNGVPTDRWKPGLTPNTTFDLDAPGFQIFLALSPSDGLNHSIDVSGVIIPDKVFEMSIEPPRFLITPDGAPSQTIFQFYCVGNGSAIGTVSIKIDGTEIVVIGFQKQCLVYSDQLSSGFCASLSDDGVPTIVVNGTFQNDWVYFADQTRSSDTFFFWTDTLQRPFLKFGLISFYMYDPKIITPIANPPKTTAYPHIRGLPSSHVGVEYNCNPNGGSTSVTMALELNGAFDDVYITWTKNCGSTAPADNGGGSSWTPAGIFFFTVFIITLTGCMGGCVYNYLARRKTGLDVIPCIDVYRRCFASLCGGSQRRVPEPSSYTAVGDSQYGATSSTAAYQSTHDNNL